LKGSELSWIRLGPIGFSGGDETGLEDDPEHDVNVLINIAAKAQGRTRHTTPTSTLIRTPAAKMPP